MRRASRPEAVAVLGERRVPSRLQYNVLNPRRATRARLAGAASALTASALGATG
jgi:hypothetical protein